MPINPAYEPGEFTPEENNPDDNILRMYQLEK